MKKYTKYIEASSKHFVIDGKHYILGKTIYKMMGKVKHQDKILLEEIDVKRDDAILDEIAKKIKKGITVEKIIKEAIKKQLGSGERENLVKLLRSGKAKVEEQDGCYGFVIKGKHFQLFD